MLGCMHAFETFGRFTTSTSFCTYLQHCALLHMEFKVVDDEAAFEKYKASLQRLQSYDRETSNVHVNVNRAVADVAYNAKQRQEVTNVRAAMRAASGRRQKKGGSQRARSFERHRVRSGLLEC